MGNPHTSAIEVSRYDSGTHATVKGLGICRMINGTVCGLHRPLEFRATRVRIMKAIRKTAKHAINSEAACNFAGSISTDSIAHNEEPAIQIKSEGVLVGLMLPANIARCCCSNSYLHRSRLLCSHP
jgi:hypothetical protein